MTDETLGGRGSVEPRSLEEGELVEQLATLVREYVARVQARPQGSSPAAHWAKRLDATESVLFAVELLRAAEITSFELASMFNL